MSLRCVYCVANWDLKQYPWLNVILFLIIYSEWNSSVKDKWNMKSIYVVGKATAALGELLSHMETLLSSNHFSFISFRLCALCFFFFFTNHCYVKANSSRVWQAPGADRSVWSDVTTLSHLEIGCTQVTVCCDTQRVYLVFRKQAGAAPSWRVLCRLSLVAVDLFVVSFFLRVVYLVIELVQINLTKSFMCVIIQWCVADTMFYPAQYGIWVWTLWGRTQGQQRSYHVLSLNVRYHFTLPHSSQFSLTFLIALIADMILYLILIIGEDTNIPPFFFPCGSIKREVLPTALRENGKLCLTIKTQGDKSPTGVTLIIKS